MKIYESVVSESFINYFYQRRGLTLMNHAANTYDIEQTLATASVLWPAIIEDDGHVFIAEFYNKKLEQLRTQFRGDKRKIERWVNAWSLDDFFLLASSPAQRNEVMLNAFAETLRFFWSLRLRTLFPSREFVVELGRDIEGERGMAITL